MKLCSSKILRLALLAAVAAVGIPLAKGQPTNPIPQLSSLDKVSSRPALFRNGSGFTDNSGGRTGQAGDYAANFTVATGGDAYVADASFINSAAANDELSIALWVKKYDITQSSAFWANSPASGGSRGIQTHIPWDNNNIYFDTAGCCGVDTRIDANIDTFPGYTGDIDWWTNNWHHLVYTKQGAVKQIYIDGELFLEGVEAMPLFADFTDLIIGGTGPFHGLIDDFSVFSTQLTDPQAKSLFTGTLPNALPASAGLLAYWDFNDVSPEGQFISVSPTPNTNGGSPDTIQVVHLDGTIAWEQSNISLKLDGVTVPATLTKTGRTATLRYVSPTLLAIQSTHTATLTYPGSGGPQTLEWMFTVAAYTKDSVAGRLGNFTGASSYTGDAGGKTGQAGDYAVNFPISGSGPVYVPDATFFNVGASNDQGTVTFWTKKYDIANGSAFWANSTQSPERRGYQAHVPWSDSSLYFDTSGCCGADTRIASNIDIFPGYTGDVGFWTNWHHFAFSKNGAVKQIWVDGELFLEGVEAIPLFTDFTDMYIGASSAAGGIYHGLIDDFSVYSTALTETQVKSLFTGTRPSALPSEAGLVANWDFNDIPPQGVFISQTPAPYSTNALPNFVQVVHLQGTVPWDLTNVSLKIDGGVVNATIIKSGSQVAVTYVPATLFAIGSKYTATLTYPGLTNDLLTREWEFTVAPYTLDSVKQYVGSLNGAAKFTADAGGKSGTAGDYGLDFGRTQAGQSVRIPDPSFLNTAGTNDEISVVGWQKLHSVANSAFYWATSPGSSGGQRGFGAFPWSDQNIYFDTAGCCDGALHRISGAGSGAPGYEDAGWWTNWHHFVYQKKGSLKEIWIDGQILATGDNTNPLPTDFTESYIGYDVPDNARLQGIVDDFAVFGTLLTEANIAQLISGTLPPALPAETKLLAYWNFNDATSGGSTNTPPTLSLSRSGSQVTITYQGTLESAAAITGPWISVAGATSPFPVVTTDKYLFYRAKN